MNRAVKIHTRSRTRQSVQRARSAAMWPRFSGRRLRAWYARLNPAGCIRLTFRLGGYEACGRSLKRNQRLARYGSTVARGERAHLPPSG